MNSSPIDIFRDEIYVPTEPVNLAEAKKQLLVTFTDDDVYIQSLITMCRSAVEDYCHISITPKQITVTKSEAPENYPNPPYGVSRWDLAFYGYVIPGNWWMLPYGPVTTVDSVTMVNGTTITMGVLDSSYFIRGAQFKQIKTNGYCDSIMIIYNTGWYDGNGNAYCPPPLKNAILSEIAFRYTNRGDSRNRYYKDNEGTLCEEARNFAKEYVDLCL